MSRASRREQLRRVYGNLPPERTGAMVAVGFANALMVITVDLALAAVLSRAVVRGWHARQQGLATAVRAGVSPWLIGLLGAMVMNELVRAVVARTLIRPALASAESSPPSSSQGTPCNADGFLTAARGCRIGHATGTASGFQDR